jgi:molybdopterin converting factor small subunit
LANYISRQIANRDCQERASKPLEGVEQRILKNKQIRRRIDGHENAGGAGDFIIMFPPSPV